MSVQSKICESMQGVIEYYTQNPGQARAQDREAVAVIEEGLLVRATGPNGQTLVCDMPKDLGGGGSAPSPGWMMRAALASCEAVMITLRAAQVGFELTTLEVRVDSVSDDRGMMGIDDTIPAGPLNMKISVCVGAPGIPPEQLKEIVAWAMKHSPVGEPLTRVMPIEYAVKIIGAQ